MKKLLYLLIIGGLIGGAIGLYLYNKPADKAVTSKVVVSTTAAQIVEDYKNDEATSNERYLNKVVAVRGTIAKINKNDETTAIVLASDDALSSVVCELSGDTGTYQVGDEVQVKGLCAGYLLDVLLTKASIIK